MTQFMHLGVSTFNYFRYTVPILFQSVMCIDGGSEVESPLTKFNTCNFVVKIELKRLSLKSFCKYSSLHWLRVL